MIAVKTVFLVLNGCMIESKLSDITARGKKKKNSCSSILSHQDLKLLVFNKSLHSVEPGLVTKATETH